jgi:hypothetical protein
MSSDVVRAISLIVIWAIAMAVILGVTAAAFDAGKAARWVVAVGLAVVMGAQPLVVVAAAGTGVTELTLILVVLMFVGTLVGVGWALRLRQPGDG